MTLDDKARSLLAELLAEARTKGSYPESQRFRLSHEADRSRIDDLLAARLIEVERSRYMVTLKAMQVLNAPESKAELTTAAALIPLLKDHYRRDAGVGEISAAELAAEAGLTEPEVERALTLLRNESAWSAVGWDEASHLVNRIHLFERVLDLWPSDFEPVGDEAAEEFGERSQQACQLLRVEIDGYRPFRNFAAEPAGLTIIIGANATGKSSFFDFLRFIRRAVTDPLPPEIDERSVGRRLFHAGSRERISFALTLDLGQRLPVRYEATILGPTGEPRVTTEKLATTKPLRDGENRPFVFLEFANGRGVVRDQRERKLVRPEWTVKANELALRRALDPTLVTLSRVQAQLAAWRFFSGFDVSSNAAIRRPAPTEPEPVLSEDGSNLSAVLLWLHHRHQSIWEELETHLRAAVPGFRALNVEPRGGPGTVIGVWTEEGVKDDLTLADLSDGTLRLLCWAVLCLSPTLPSLICLDEPELGLHPRVLPILAGLLRLASARTQILVATHSPYFLSCFSLDEIAVMRKEDGAARFLRPGTNRALRSMVQDVGAEALSRLYLSDELETLP